MNKRNFFVSICCLTYNHALYIRQCLDGFIMQETNFPIEILIHDDASTDGTQEIIKGYEAKYPNIIKPIYQKENQYSKGVKVSLYNYSRAKGKYIAICEGDDYWTDPYKLQKQVDFLESHPNYVMCSHKYIRLRDNNAEILPKDISKYGRIYSLNDLIRGNWFFQPLTIMYRCESLDLKYLKTYEHTKDLTLIYALLRKGNGICMPDIMGVYRIHSNGIWSGIGMNERKLQNLLVKRSIYRVEQTPEAATYILNEFCSAMSRIWMLTHIMLFVDIIKILSRHFGVLFTIKLFIKKMFFNKVYVPFNK